jgi:hypothetical protein
MKRTFIMKKCERPSETSRTNAGGGTVAGRGARDSSRQTIVEQHEHVPHPSDLLIEPIERLKRLKGVVTLLASLGSTDHECTDPDVILRFSELVEEHLELSLEELDAVQQALA